MGVSVAIVLVALLRRPWRRVFGAERAYALWCAVPLAAAMAWVPHSGAAPLPTSVTTLIDASIPGASATVSTAGTVGPSIAEGLTVAWTAGSATWIIAICWAQRRYARRLRGARLTAMPGTSLRVLTSTDASVGPALFGALTPRIVLPADFTTRFEPLERALVIRHEAIHARRHDSRWLVVAQGLAAAFWFNPLTWWALRAFRQDQELACDAAVIRKRPGDRRAYASAMLKAHDATLLPIGCTWTSHHPLTERIAMLKLATPSHRRRTIALAALPFAAMAVIGAAYAASPGTTQASRATYQLATHFEQNATALADATVCLEQGSPATIRDTTKTGKDDWQLMFNVTPLPGDLVQVDIDSSFDDGHERKATHQALRGKVGETMSVRYGATADAGLRTLQITSANGCPAAAAKQVVQVNATVDRGTARATALAIAAHGGLTLVNPEALDEQPVGLNFEHLDAREAIRHVAEIDGRTATFDGDRVRFARK
jgi:beta-lactamase regulating signal transducer with metallopeptidase domain